MNLLDLFVKIAVDDQASGKIEGITTGAIAKATAMGNAMYDVAKGVASAAYEGISTIASGALEGYASYEQLVGGVNKLYGDASEKLQQYAQDAYRTAGMSANQYMEQATSFSAALVNALGGDVDKAADLTNVAMKAMSDNVNTFGTDMGSVQYAFQGFAKQNYTMLDNLKLGYGGTKAEMARLIKDSGVLGDMADELTAKNLDQLVSFDKIIEAIQVVQENQNIAGTTAKEAATTIEGSLNMTKAAWENLLTAIGSGDPELLDNAITGLVDGIFGTFNEKIGEREGGLISNVIPVVQNVANAIFEQIPTVAASLAQAFVESFGAMLGVDPAMFTGMFDGMYEGFVSVRDRLVQAATDFWDGFTSTFKADEFANAFDHIQSIAEQVFTFLVDNADTIGAALGIAADVLGAIADAVTTIIDVLGPFLPAIVGAIAAFSGLSALSSVIATISGAFSVLTTVILPALGMVQSLGGAFALLTTLLGGPIPIIAAIVGAIVAFVATNEDARNAIIGAVQAVIDFVASIPEKVGEFIDSVKAKLELLQWAVGFIFNYVVGNISAALDDAKEAVSTGVDSVVDFFTNLPDRILAALSGLGDLLSNAGHSIIDGLWEGMQSAARGMFDWVGGIAGKIASLKGPLSYDKTVLVSNGMALIDGLQTGLEGQFEGKVLPFVSAMAGEMEGAFGRPDLSMGLSVPYSPAQYAQGAGGSDGDRSQIVINVNVEGSGTDWYEQGLKIGEATAYELRMLGVSA